MNHRTAAPDASPCFALSHVRCPSDHRANARCAYRVAWKINPHMRIGSVDPCAARDEHRVLRAALLHAGATLLELPFVHGAYDSVFVKDNAVLLARDGRCHALLAHPMHPQRRAEQGARASVYDSLGFTVHEAPRAVLEGGDVVMLPGTQGALLGHGPRSSRDAAIALERFLDAPVVPVRLCDPRLYHLDTALTVLSDGTALACRSAFDRDGLAAIERAPGVRRMVFVPVEEALGFGLNTVEVHDAVLLARGAPTVCAALRGLGFSPVELPLDAFRAAGGSAACLVARVHRQDRVATSSTTAMRSTSRYASRSSSSPNTSGSISP